MEMLSFLEGQEYEARECARSHQLSTILVNKFVWNLFAQWIDLAGISICGCYIHIEYVDVCWCLLVWMCLFLRYFSRRRFSICNLSAFNNLWNVFSQQSNAFSPSQVARRAAGVFVCIDANLWICSFERVHPETSAIYSQQFSEDSSLLIPMNYFIEATK